MSPSILISQRSLHRRYTSDHRSRRRFFLPRRRLEALGRAALLLVLMSCHSKKASYNKCRARTDAGEFETFQLATLIEHVRPARTQAALRILYISWLPWIYARIYPQLHRRDMSGCQQFMRFAALCFFFFLFERRRFAATET